MRNSGIFFKFLLALLLTDIAQAEPSDDLTHLWGQEEITASRFMNKDYVAANAPIWDADPMNITLIVESEGRNVTLLDGDRYEQLDRFPVKFSVLADPKFSPDGRYAYFLSHAGVVQKHDIWSLKSVGSVKTGLLATNMAISADGKWLAVSNVLPPTLIILSTKDLVATAVIPAKIGGGKYSNISAVRHNPPRQSFVIALTDVPKIWEIFYGSHAPAMGFAHDWRVEGPIVQETSFPIRRFTLAAPLESFTFDPSYEYILGVTRAGVAQVTDLVIGQKQADLALPGKPYFHVSHSWQHKGAQVMALPNIYDAVVSVIDLKSWKTITEIPSLGPSFVLNSHENSKYLWVSRFLDQGNMDAVQIIDKQTLKAVKTLRPLAGANSVEVTFSKDGSRVLLSARQNKGVVIVYDANSLQELSRLPIENPVGIYINSGTPERK